MPTPFFPLSSFLATSIHPSSAMPLANFLCELWGKMSLKNKEEVGSEINYCSFIPSEHGSLVENVRKDRNAR